MDERKRVEVHGASDDEQAQIEPAAALEATESVSVLPEPDEKAEQAVDEAVETTEAEAPAVPKTVDESGTPDELLAEEATSDLQRDEAVAVDEQPDESALPAATPIIPAAANASSKRKKWRVLALVGAVLLVGVCAMLWLANSSIKPAATQQTSTNPTPQPATPKLGLAVTLIDGTATYQAASSTTVQPLTATTQLGEGDTLSTAANSRLVLTFDDGSALRLDGLSTITLESLTATSIRVAQTAGTAYSRVVPSERSYVVTVDGVNYTAMGTAFATDSGSEVQGIRVYQSSVKVDGVEEVVAEGKQYYKQHRDSKLRAKVSSIDLDALDKDSFAKWNLSQDEKIALFKDKLGVFKQLREKQAKDKQKTEAAKKKQAEAAKGIRLAGLSVSGGAKFTWSVSGVDAPHGFKLVRSSSSSTPTFGKDDAVYMSDPSTRSYTWKSEKDGTYWYRMCVYRKEQGCDTYSNAIQIKVTGTKPKTVDTPTAKVTRGTLTLHSISASGKAQWSFTGTAPHGYKLVYSKAQQPTYPGSNFVYVSDGAATQSDIPFKKSGTYYVRICAYTNGTEDDACVNYSNQLTYTKL